MEQQISSKEIISSYSIEPTPVPGSTEGELPGDGSVPIASFMSPPKIQATAVHNSALDHGQYLHSPNEFLLTSFLPRVPKPSRKDMDENICCAPGSSQECSLKPLLSDPSFHQEGLSDEEMGGSGELGMEPSTSAQETIIELMNSGFQGIAAASAIKSYQRIQSELAEPNATNSVHVPGGFSFETNPTTRKRVRNRLIRKIRRLLEEFSVRTGEQAAMLSLTPSAKNKGSSQFEYLSLGSQPLLKVLKSQEEMIESKMHEELLIARRSCEISSLSGGICVSQHQSPRELPQLLQNGVPVSLNDLNQVTWTEALRKIIASCYAYFGKEVLLKSYDDIRAVK